MKTNKSKRLVKKVHTICDFTLPSQNSFPTETTLGTDPTNTTITTFTTVNTHPGR